VKRDDLEREVSTESTESKDGKINDKKAELTQVN